MASGGVSKTKHKWSDSGNKFQKQSKPTMVRSIPLSNSHGSDDNHDQMMKIDLSSISKLEVSNLKRKLVTELDEVRSLLKRLQGNNKKVKTGNGGGDKGTVQIMKNCNNLLTKLMKHKSGWVFNTPVDAKSLGLHDYHTIVTKPMDLGTVKNKLSKSLYHSPLEFAADVRLTFNNAMLYNPKGHDVHHMAEFLLKMFEDKWAPLETQYESLNRRRQQQTRDIDFRAHVPTHHPYVEPLPLRAPTPTNRPYVESLPSRAPTPSPSPPLPPPTVVENRTLERAESMTNLVEPAMLTVSSKKRGEEEGNKSRSRDLTFDEKRRLSEDLQDLPFDKLEAVVEIIKKSNPELAQQDDEIELDIDSLDLETLWELYRFVTIYKESSSKKKENQGMGSERDAESAHNSVQEPNTLVTGHESTKDTGHVASPGRQEVNGVGSSSSNSSSSGSGSCSSDSESENLGHGSDTGN